MFGKYKFKHNIDLVSRKLFKPLFLRLDQIYHRTMTYDKTFHGRFEVYQKKLMDSRTARNPLDNGKEIFYTKHNVLILQATDNRQV